MPSSAGSADRIAAFARSFTLEATRPSVAEINDIAGILGRGCQIYLSAVPSQSFRQLADLAAVVRRAGFEPVSHLPARRLTSAAELAGFLSRVAGEAGMRQLLVIAGDGEPAGPYHDALAVIRDGALRNAGIEEVGVAGYPENHHRIAPDKIATALRDKIAAAAATGLRLHIVSQFSFSPEKIVAWLKHLRAAGIGAPVKVGMAGPTSVPALLRYAKRCGVGASIRGLLSGAPAGLFGHVGPDRIIDALAAAGGDVGNATPHYFSFGGVAETARYAQDLATGRSAGRHAKTGSNSA
jgi:methylenetetrahydrofolate reductase (NADPH)